MRGWCHKSDLSADGAMPLRLGRPLAREIRAVALITPSTLPHRGRRQPNSSAAAQQAAELAKAD